MAGSSGYAGVEPGQSAGEVPEDLGDEEVAAAEAAISHTGAPELGSVSVPPVPPTPELAASAELPVADPSVEAELPVADR